MTDITAKPTRGAKAVDEFKVISPHIIERILDFGEGPAFSGPILPQGEGTQSCNGIVGPLLFRFTIDLG